MTSNTITTHAPNPVSLNSELNLWGEDGGIQFEKDREAVRQYFRQEILPNTVSFLDHSDKLDFLIEEGYYDPAVFEQYDREFIVLAYKTAYAYNFRFKSFVGALKFYTGYALKTFDGTRFLERYEDRVVANALDLARGDEKHALGLIDAIITGQLQPATPTFSNAGLKNAGERISCFLLDTHDSLDSIMNTIKSASNLSKMGGGVGINLTNIRAVGDPIRNVEGVASGVIPYAKVLEDTFKWINQLGQRQGACVVYIHAHHMDVMTLLDSKRENADEAIRLKTLSVGITIPDITYELAAKGEDMYLFSPYDVKKVYGREFSEMGITENYRELVENPAIRKSRINARKFFMTLAELRAESGYPYILNIDTANAGNPAGGTVKMSNLCVTGGTRILTDQGYKTVSDLFESQEEFKVGVDTRARDMDIENVGFSLEDSTKMFLTQEGADVYRLTTKEGHSITATEWHKFYVVRDRELVKIPLAEVEEGDKVLVQPEEGVFGSVNEVDLAYIAGGIAADGTFYEGASENAYGGVRLDLYGTKREFALYYQESVHNVLDKHPVEFNRQSTKTPKFREGTKADKVMLSSTPLRKVLDSFGYSKGRVPEFVWAGTRETQQAYISGLFQLDGSITGSKSSGSLMIELGSTHPELLREVQILLLNFGVYSRVYAGRTEAVLVDMPDGHGGVTPYLQQPMWSLRTSSRTDSTALFKLITWREEHQARWDALTANESGREHYRTHKYLATVVSIEYAGIADVYDVTVENGNSVIFNGITTGNCSEILQPQSPSTFDDEGNYETVGQDISCNLASLNVARIMEYGNVEKVVDMAVRGLTAVSDLTEIKRAPTVAKANSSSHSIGLGQMNLAGFFGKERMIYGDEDSLEFTSAYFSMINFYTLKTSNAIARETGVTFEGFEESDYASGKYFEKYRTVSFTPQRGKVVEIFDRYGITVPEILDWEALEESVAKYGLYHSHRQAVAPTGSISYLSHSTSSITPITSLIEIRKEGKMGRVYFPAPEMDNENKEFFVDAYDLGPEAIIDVYAAAQPHVDQGMSMNLFFKEPSMKKFVNSIMYAHKKGIKTLYYSRLQQQALEGTEAADCISCTL